MRSMRTPIWCVVLLVGIFIMAPGAGWPCMAEDPVILPDPNLPPESDPPDCDDLISLYAGKGQLLLYDIFPFTCTMSDIRHRCFTEVNRQTVGSDEIETFDSIWDAVMDFGSGPVLVSLIGPVATKTVGKALSTTGTFDAEIVSMSLSGNAGEFTIILREDPVRASLGRTAITDLGGGLYQIESFFDVLTELSVDGGETWVAAADFGQLTLVPAWTVATRHTSWGAIKSIYK
jgi:hypothetical protein